MCNNTETESWRACDVLVGIWKQSEQEVLNETCSRPPSQKKKIRHSSVSTEITICKQDSCAQKDVTFRVRWVRGGRQEGKEGSSGLPQAAFSYPEPVLLLSTDVPMNSYTAPRHHGTITHQPEDFPNGGFGPDLLCYPPLSHGSSTEEPSLARSVTPEAT